MISGIGGNGAFLLGTGPFVQGGAGGQAGFNSGPSLIAVGHPGHPGIFPGGGGSGAGGATVFGAGHVHPGGTGAPGLVVVEW